MVNIEKFFISFNFAFSMTLISNIFWTSIISITGKSANGIFTWLIILSDSVKNSPISIPIGQFRSTVDRFCKIKPRSEKIMLLKFWTTFSTTDSSNSILIFIFSTAKVFWYISIDVKLIEAAILIVFGIKMCDFELKIFYKTGQFK